MAHQAEMENHRYHCHLGLNFPLSGERVLWNSQEDPTLEAEGAVWGSPPLPPTLNESQKILLRFYFSSKWAIDAYALHNLSFSVFLSCLTCPVKWRKHFLTSQYFLISQGCCKGNYTKVCKLHYEWSSISTLRMNIIPKEQKHLPFLWQLQKPVQYIQYLPQQQ